MTRDEALESLRALLAQYDEASAEHSEAMEEEEASGHIDVKEYEGYEDTLLELVHEIATVARELVRE